MANLNYKYEQLLEYNKELAIIGSASSILHWDMETKMPPQGVELRSQQLAFLQKTIHQKLTNPETGKLLDSIEKDPDYDTLDQVAVRNVYLSKKAYNEAIKLPEKLVVDITKQQTIGVNVWKRAKSAKNWSLFMPELIKIKELKEQEAELLMDIKGAKTPYDALIDNFEPKMTSEKITYLFDEMKNGLQKILKNALEEKNVDTEFLKRKVPIEIQEKISKDMANFVHYDTSSDNAGGRIDTTEHPFTTGYYTDVRITTNYHENQFTSSIFSVLHEAGHALYEQNFPQDWIYQPVGSSASYGIHESMSRFIENLVGRSPEFWNYYFPKLKVITGNIFQDISRERMLKAINNIIPSKIRIEADEVTYGLHIIIRFEIERDLFEGKLDISELPEVWNQKYMDYLGVVIEDDSEGVLQDTHWASGLFGYFPSYALGNIYDGVWLTKLEIDLPAWKMEMQEGNFSYTYNWLKSNVYNYGNLLDPEDLVKKVTCKDLVVQPFIDYLENKFAQMYNY